MPAYWIAHAHVIDQAQYTRYAELVPPIVDRFGGTILARGGRFQVMEGPDAFERHVVIQFPTLEQAVACFQSPEYQAAAAFRRDGGGTVHNVIVEGLPGA